MEVHKDMIDGDLLVITAGVLGNDTQEIRYEYCETNKTSFHLSSSLCPSNEERVICLVYDMLVEGLIYAMR